LTAGTGAKQPGSRLAPEDSSSTVPLGSHSTPSVVPASAGARRAAFLPAECARVASNSNELAVQQDLSLLKMQQIPLNMPNWGGQKGLFRIEVG